MREVSRQSKKLERHLDQPQANLPAVDIAELRRAEAEAWIAEADGIERVDRATETAIVAVLEAPRRPGGLSGNTAGLRLCVGYRNKENEEESSSKKPQDGVHNPSLARRSDQRCVVRLVSPTRMKVNG